MPRCYFCNEEIHIAGRVMRKDLCPRCRRDLHCCLQCRFHDPGYHNQCREPRSEMIRDRDKANLCDYFELGAKTPGREAEQGKSREELERLFGKK